MFSYEVGDDAYVVVFSKNWEPELVVFEVINTSPMRVRDYSGFMIEFNDNGCYVSNTGNTIYKLFNSKKEAKKVIKKRGTRNKLVEYFNNLNGLLSDSELEDVCSYIQAKIDEKTGGK